MKKIIFKCLSIPIFIMLSSVFFIFFNSCKDSNLDIDNINKLNDSIQILNRKIILNSEIITIKDSTIYLLEDSINNLKNNLNSEIIKNEKLDDSLFLYKNKFYGAKLNTMSYNNFSALYKLARIERYVNICDKNPKNKVFFFGWIKRAVKQ